MLLLYDDTSLHANCTLMSLTRCTCVFHCCVPDVPLPSLCTYLSVYVYKLVLLYYCYTMIGPGGTHDYMLPLRYLACRASPSGTRYRIIFYDQVCTLIQLLYTLVLYTPVYTASTLTASTTVLLLPVLVVMHRQQRCRMATC
jgi:hypothetical protein